MATPLTNDEDHVPENETSDSARLDKDRDETEELVPTSTSLFGVPTSGAPPVMLGAAESVREPINPRKSAIADISDTVRSPASSATSNDVPKRISTKIGELYNEIEPEYRRLVGGNLDFDKIDFDEKVSQWQYLKQTDPAPAPKSSIGEDIQNLQIQDRPVQREALGVATSEQEDPPARLDVSNATGTSPSASQGTNDELVQPEIHFASARKQRQGSIELANEEDDHRPDAAKMEDLKRFAYAHGSAGARKVKAKAEKKTISPATKSVPSVPAPNEAPAPGHDTIDHAEPTTTISASGENLSFSHKSKVAKILGLKRDRPESQGPKSTRSLQDDQNADMWGVTGEGEAAESDLESIDSYESASQDFAVPSTLATTPHRQVSFRRTAGSTDSLVRSDRTAKRALLIKAAHMEVCNHVSSASRGRQSSTTPAGGQANGTGGWHVINLAGLSFWDRLTDLEKLKSQATIIDIMRAYSYEAQFSSSSDEVSRLNQISARDGRSRVNHDAAVSLDPKSDLPLSTDIDNEVGRSRAAAEFIIEKLSAKLTGAVFRDEEDNVFRVPIKGHGPLSRIQGDGEWRLVQEAVSAHALGRGYQVQMGDGPEEITRPWQVRQKEDLKDALVSFTKWPSASELIWVKVNRLGIEN